MSTWFFSPLFEDRISKKAPFFKIFFYFAGRLSRRTAKGLCLMLENVRDWPQIIGWEGGLGVVNSL